MSRAGDRDVRPFVLTHGRTRPHGSGQGEALRIETLLVADLADDGLVHVWTDPNPVDRVTLERILDRVSAL